MSRIEDKYNIERVIKVLRNTGEVPTVPSSDYKSDGTWLNTDIYSGQIAVNEVDDRIWYRSDDVIIDINNSADTSIYNETIILISGATAWSGSTQTASISYTLDSESQVWVSPLSNRTDTDNYINASIICTGDTTTGLTFECVTTPTSNINVNVKIKV